ncbi:putative nuclease HARBI1 [Labrus bergylta]|uniref:putative nuclease HARBI1 n=1 Tax=Labrus bergylta TaxID=56723 RepID=UPI0033143309
MKRVVHLPAADELEGIGEGFAHLAGSHAFCRVAGSIDGTHIRIKPPAANKEDYLNRKLFHSIQLLVVCGHKGRFLNTYTGLPGSVHDAGSCGGVLCTYTNSTSHMAGVLLGMGVSLPGCTNQPDDPIQGAGAKPCSYNWHHAKARCVVERAIGMMKTRWRSIFLKALEIKPTFVPAAVSTCVFLHNLSINNGDLVEPEVEEGSFHDQGDDHPNNPDDQTPGDNMRDRLAPEVFAPIGVIQALEDRNY